MNFPKSVAAALVSLVTLSLTPSAAAAADWKWSVTPYAWATDVGVDVQVGDREIVDETIPVEDLLEDLDTIAQVRIEAQNGSFGLFADLFDVTVSDDAQTLELPSGNGTATFAPEMGMTLFDAGAIYDPAGDQQGFQLLYGARLLDQRATIDATASLADGSSRSKKLEIHDTVVDALVGFRYLHAIGNRVTLQAQADLSTGGTELTWSFGPTVGYRFGEGGRYTATAGYRHMVVDFETDEEVDAKMTLSGFVAGLRIAF